MTSSARICVEWAALGPKLSLRRKVVIELSSHRIESIEIGSFNRCDEVFPKHVATPPLFNAHAHPMDRAWAGYGLGLPIESLVSPRRGLKYRLLKKALEEDPELVEQALEEFSLECISSGVVACAAVAEMGGVGVEYLRKHLWVPHIALSQPEPEEVESFESYARLLKRFRALALNTALDLELEELEELRKLATELGAYVQVHVSETERLYRARDFELVEKPFVSIHCTYLSRDELLQHASRVRAVVACPRSNALLVSKQPSYEALAELALRGYATGFGTDNASWQDPDTLSEAAYAARAGLDPAKALYMATVGGARALGAPYAGLSVGSPPIALVLRVSPSTNPIASAVLRSATPRLLVVGTRVLSLGRLGDDEARRVASECRRALAKGGFTYLAD